MSDRLVITMLGEPVAWARTRPQARTGILFTPKKQRNAAAVFHDLAREAMAGRAIFEGPLAIELLCVFAIPKLWSKKKRRENGAAWAPKRPDYDNCAKQIQDAANGVIWRDDAQIVDARVRKIYGMVPRIELSVRAL